MQTPMLDRSRHGLNRVAGSIRRSRLAVKAMIRAAIALTGWAIATSSIAHHSVGVFYEAEPTGRISGTITEVAWINPHIRLTLESPLRDGASETWTIEAGSVNSLERNGIGREQLQIGSQVTIIGRPSRLGQKALYATAVQRSDGNTVALVGQFGEQQVARLLAEAGPSARTASRDLFRVWLKGRAYGDPVNLSASGLDLPYTPAAVAARESYNPLTDDTALECIAQGMPGIMDNPFPIEFLDQGNTIVLKLEEWDTVRTIHMAPAVSAESQPASALGYSIGRWDADTLVVETSRIDWPFFDDVGTPQGDALEVVEHFTVSEDGARLNYEITITDPATFSEPVNLTGYWVWAPGQEIKPYNCTL